MKRSDPPHSVVISGEASESSDDEIEIDTSESRVTPLQGRTAPDNIWGII